MESSWRPRAEYPDLSSAKIIGIDVETRDPNLETLGPGGVRHDGNVVGVSVAVQGFTNYYPIGHEGGDNLPGDTVLRWLRRELGRSNQPKVGHHILYDLEWLEVEGVKVLGPKHCTQVRETLINENQDGYDLSSCLVRRGFPPKDESLLMQYGFSQGYKNESQVKANLWKFPARFVGPYATVDAASSLALFDAQSPLLDEYQLGRIYQLESKLIDVLLAMRFQGVPVNLDLAERAIVELTNKQRDAQRTLDSLVGASVDVWSPSSVQAAVAKAGVTPPRTPKGNPSVTADWLELQNNDICRNLVRVRKLDRAAEVFVRSKIINCSYKGRIYPEFIQTRTETYGTRTGRFASANPNLQQVPKRNEELAKVIRNIFGWENGKFWGGFDYSQQEPRITVHYAALRQLHGAEEARGHYRDNPATDYHDLTRQLVLQYSGKNLTRRVAKDINLGITYTMGALKLCKKCGLPTEWLRKGEELIEVPGKEGQEILAAYHKGMPFIKELINDVMRVAKDRGYVKTAMGRRCNLESRFAHKGLNRVIQGTAAEMTKLAMVTTYEAGIIPYVTVHDELGVPINRDNFVKETKVVEEIMIQTGVDMGITVPMKVDVAVGESWGNGKEVKDVVAS